MIRRISQTVWRLLPGRAKEDAAEDDDQCRGEDERVERHFMFRVDFRKEATRWKPTVSAHQISICDASFQIARNDIPGESIGHTTACGHDTGRGK